MQPLLYLLLFLAHFCSSFQDELFCDKDKCANVQLLQEWFQQVQDEQNNLLNFHAVQQPLDEEGSLERLIKVVSCDTKDARWDYKYTGSKGKNRIFTGKGKITFTEFNTPPHGFNYGMKSGHCLIKYKENIKSIEGEFDAQGQIQSLMTIDFFDKPRTRIIGNATDTILNGLTRTFVDEIDPETNSPKVAKILESLEVYKNGKKVQNGAKWMFRINGIKMFQEHENKNNVILLAPQESEDGYDVLIGELDIENDMLLKAKEAQITFIGNQNGLLTLKAQAEEDGQLFDYDFYSKVKTKATQGKLIRFFEFIAYDKNKLEDKYQVLEEPVDPAKAIRILSDFKPLKDGVNDDLFEASCPYDASEKCIVQKEFADDVTDGDVSFKMFSNWTYAKLIDARLVNGTQIIGYLNLTEKNLKEYLGHSSVGYFIDDLSITAIRGSYKNGLLDGPIEITYQNGWTLEGLAKEGALHGIARVLEGSKYAEYRTRYEPTRVEIDSGINYNSKPKIRELLHCAIFRNGYVEGPKWDFIQGANFRFGLMDGQSKSIFRFDSKTRAAYINQDLHSGYVGEFSNGVMVSGQAADLENIEFIDGMIVPVFSNPRGQVYHSFTSEDGTITDPLTPDPLEDKYVYVNDSKWIENEQGLFSKTNISANTIFAYFGGFLYTSQQWNSTNITYPRFYAKFADGSHVYYVHIPDELGEDVSKYKATLGHKINHSFHFYNCMFVCTNHPRFGLIAAARTIRDVQENEEFLCAYNLEFHEGQPWYQELFRTNVEQDTPEGPYGHREAKKETGQPIQPMLTDTELYKAFFQHATLTLKLDPFT